MRPQTYLYLSFISTLAKSATAKRQEVIRITELLLNALNQGDYEIYSRLCDPHMTSFEPENLGNLVDNMEYRRFCLDQARQLQFHHLHQQQIISHNNGHLAAQQVAAAAAAAAAAASAALSASAAGCQPPATPTKQHQQNSTGNTSLNQMQLQQIVNTTVHAALANLNLTAASQSQNNANIGQQQVNPSGQSLQQQQTANSYQSSAFSASAKRQYSLILNPSVYLMGDDAASIAYTKLSQVMDLDSGHVSTEQSEETRIWHKKDGNKWLCVHLHRSGRPYSLGPQTNASLVQSVANQQQHYQPPKISD